MSELTDRSAAFHPPMDVGFGPGPMPSRATMVDVVRCSAAVPFRAHSDPESVMEIFAVFAILAPTMASTTIHSEGDILFSDDQVEHFSTQHAADACTVCRHVLQGESVTHFAHDSFTYVAGCCANCLYDRKNRARIRCDHLFAAQPELLSLLHLPVYGLAVYDQEGWKLGILDVKQEDNLIEGRPYTKRNFADFAKDHETLAILAFGKLAHETSFHSGLRFMPGWLSLNAANNYRKKTMHVIPRLYTRAREVGIDELQMMLADAGHNYLCIQEVGHQWECLIVDETLHMERNTLLLY